MDAYTEVALALVTRLVACENRFPLGGGTSNVCAGLAHVELLDRGMTPQRCGAPHDLQDYDAAGKAPENGRLRVGNPLKDSDMLEAPTHSQAEAPRKAERAAFPRPVQLAPQMESGCEPGLCTDVDL